MISLSKYLTQLFYYFYKNNAKGDYQFTGWAIIHDNKDSLGVIIQVLLLPS